MADKLSAKNLIGGAAVHIANGNKTLSQCQSCLKGFSQAQTNIFFDFKAINHHFNSMFFLFIQCRSFVQVTDQAVDTSADKTLSAQAVKSGSSTHNSAR